MKKLIAIAALFAAVTVASAQQLGVVGGLTLSEMNGAKNVDDIKSKTLFHAGLVCKMDLGAGFAVQPGLTYSVKGSTVQEGVGALDNISESKTGYVEFGLGAQWGPDLLAFRPFVFVEPFIGYGVTGKDSEKLAKVDYTFAEADQQITEAKNKLEYGVGAGVGLEVANHVQLTCQLFRNMGPLYNQDKVAAIGSPYTHLKSYQGLKLSLAILF